MSTLLRKSFDSPDETRAFGAGMGHLDVVNTEEGAVGRAVFEPGWRWSDHIKPIAGTDSCQVHHVGTVTAGRLHVEHQDGTTVEIGPGDAYVIEPGHDAWVVGTESFVGYEFDSQAAETYAQS